MNNVILFKLEEKKEKESMRSLKIEHIKKDKKLNKVDIQDIMKTKNIHHMKETISIDNVLYNIFINGDIEKEKENINYGFWWSYGDLNGKYKYYGDILCVKEIEYEIN